MVGAKGFEPSTSWSRTRRASQAALRPECASLTQFTRDCTRLQPLAVGISLGSARPKSSSFGGPRDKLLRTLPPGAYPG